ncbi:hypothetical protein XYCOK13_18540 [Xylanibacillus composti]|uniref:Uncharacterized protein n=2 Tax=Xylanibacillus composti TaxID=1572762 RepID=A0A8J4M1N2_9BACL|nr:hypothetical protein XYCOK13_18540 [Xylanibacillus composti]
MQGQAASSRSACRRQQRTGTEHASKQVVCNVQEQRMQAGERVRYVQEVNMQAGEALYRNGICM